MMEELGITANLSDTSLSFNHQKNHPPNFLYQNVINNKQEDFVSCLQKLQYHKCSAFCMKKQHVL